MSKDLFTGTVYRNYIKSNKIIKNGCLDKKSLIEDKSVDDRKNEIKELALKYSLSTNVIKRLSKFSLLNNSLECGNITKTADFIVVILKNIYNFTDEEVSEYLNKNAFIMMCSYVDFRARLSIFNHLGLLDEIIFKGTFFLGYEFTKAHYGTYSLYALIMSKNINSTEELKDLVVRTPESKINNLKKIYPLTRELLLEYDEELLRKIKKESFKLEYLRRRKVRNNGE